MPLAVEDLTRALELFERILRDDDALAAELEAAPRDFFTAPPEAREGEDEARLAARRYLEWFVLERHSPTLFGAPVERLLERWRAAADPDVAQTAEALLGSLTGIFAVTDVRPGDGVRVRDIAGFGEYPLHEPAGSELLLAGDMIVGRLFPVGSALYVASPAAGVFRDPGLLDALERDLGRLRDARNGKVLHVSQHELETMFFGASAGEPEPQAVADPVGEAHRFLLAAGIDPEEIDVIFARLAREPFDATRVVHGASDELGAILDDLAFETAADLGRARALLQQAWSRLPGARAPSARRGAPAKRGARPDRRAAVEAFERGRAAGADLDSLIADLERDLALDAAADDDDEDSPAPDFPGVVGAMIEEFRWEVGCLYGAADAERLRPLELLARYAERIGVFDDLNARELLQFTAFWVHEKRALANAQEARALLEALDAFCAWTEEAHEMSLAREFAPTLESLRDSLPRIAAANRELPRAPAAAVGELYEILAGETRNAELRDRTGATHAVDLAPALREQLCPGDQIRASIAPDGAVTVFCCYPPEALDLARA